MYTGHGHHLHVMHIYAAVSLQLRRDCDAIATNNPPRDFCATHIRRTQIARRRIAVATTALYCTHNLSLRSCTKLYRFGASDTQFDKGCYVKQRCSYRQSAPLNFESIWVSTTSLNSWTTYWSTKMALSRVHTSAKTNSPSNSVKTYPKVKLLAV